MANTKTTTKSEASVKAAPKKKKFGQSDPVTCVSNTEGFLSMVGIKSGINYRWEMNGDSSDVEYADLAAAVRAKSDYIFKPYFIIQDPDFVREFAELERFYSTLYRPSDLSDILALPPKEMKAAVLKLPDGIKESVKTLASSKIIDGTLDSIQKVKMLDEIFGTKLMLLTELFD